MNNQSIKEGFINQIKPQSGEKIGLNNKIQQLKKTLEEDLNAGFKDLISQMLLHTEHQDFFKFKELFLNICDKIPELPLLTETQADNFIECFLQICQKNPSPMASKGFKLFYKFLANKENLPNNQIISSRFQFTKNNLRKLGLPSYFDDKEYLELAMNYALFYLLKTEYTSAYAIVESPQHADLINWCEKRNTNNILKTIFDEVNNLVDQQKDQTKNQMEKIEKFEQTMNNIYEITDQNKQNLNVVMNKQSEYDKSLQNNNLESMIKEIGAQLSNKFVTKDTMDFWKNELIKHIADAKEQYNQINTNITKQTEKMHEKFQKIEEKIQRVQDQSINTQEVIQKNANDTMKCLTSQYNIYKDLDQLNQRTSNIQNNLVDTKDILVEKYENLNNIFNKTITEINNKIDTPEIMIKDLNNRYNEMIEFMTKYKDTGNIDDYHQSILKFQNEINQMKLNEEMRYTNINETLRNLSEKNSKYEIKITKLIDDLVQNQSEYMIRIDENNNDIRFLKERYNILSNFNLEITNATTTSNMKNEQIRGDLSKGFNDLKIKMGNIEDKYEMRLRKIEVELMNNLKSTINLNNFETTYKDISQKTNKNRIYDHINESDSLSLEAKISKLTIENAVLHNSINEKGMTMQEINKKLTELNSQLEILKKYFGLSFDTLGDPEIYLKSVQDLLIQSKEINLNPVENGKQLPNDKPTSTSVSNGTNQQTSSEKEINNREESINLPKGILESPITLRLYEQIQSLSIELKSISNRLPLFNQKTGIILKIFDSLKGLSGAGEVLDMELYKNEEILNRNLKVNPDANFKDIMENEISNASQEYANSSVNLLKTKMMVEIEALANKINITNNNFEEIYNSLAKKIQDLDIAIKTKDISEETSSRIYNIEAEIEQLKLIKQDNIDKLFNMKFKEIEELRENISYFKTNIDNLAEHLGMLEKDFNNIDSKLNKISTQNQRTLTNNKTQNRNLSSSKLVNIGQDDSLAIGTSNTGNILQAPIQISKENSLTLIGGSDINSVFLESRLDEELKIKLDLYDLISQDYYEFTFIPKTYHQFSRMSIPNSGLEEKISAFLYLIRHYKLTPTKILKGAVWRFNEVLFFNKENPRLSKICDDLYIEIEIIIKHFVDFDFHINFSYVLDGLYLLFGDEKILEKVFERKLFNILIRMVDYLDQKIYSKSSLVKIISYLCKYDNIIFELNNKHLMPNISSMMIPTLEYYAQMRTVYVNERDDLDTIEEMTSIKSLSMNDDLKKGSKLIKENDYKYNSFNQIQQIIKSKYSNIKTLGIINIDNQNNNDQVKTNQEEISKIEESDLIKDLDYNKLFFDILLILQRRELPVNIKEISFHLLYKISKSKRITENIFHGNTLLDTIIVNYNNQIDQANNFSLIAYGVLINLSKNEVIYDAIKQLEPNLDLNSNSNEIYTIETIVYNTHPKILPFTADYFQNTLTSNSKDFGHSRVTLGPLIHKKRYSSDNNMIKDLSFVNEEQPAKIPNPVGNTSLDTNNKLEKIYNPKMFGNKSSNSTYRKKIMGYRLPEQKDGNHSVSNKANLKK